MWRSVITTVVLISIFLTSCCLLLVSPASSHVVTYLLNYTSYSFLSIDNQTKVHWLNSSKWVNDTGYQPAFPYYTLQKGIVSYGDLARTRRLMHKLIQGKPITAVAVGGSITWGHGASEIGVNDYAARVFRWINGTFPYANHTTVNAGVPATPSTYMSLCMNRYVPSHTDLVIVEYNVNDEDGYETKGNSPLRRGHERLLRRLLALPSRPAVIELVFMRWPDEEAKQIFPVLYRYHGDDEIGVFAQYYHLPWLSTRTLMWDKDGQNLSNETNWMADPRHPNTRGHGYVADLVIGLLSRAAAGLQSQPLTKGEVASIFQPLTPPMYPGNLPPSVETCMIEGAFKGVFVSTRGFTWRNEGTEIKQKWGMVATAANSTAVIRLNTMQGVDGGGGNVTDSKETKPARLYLAYLKSYQHMGKMRVLCRYCTCEPSTVDGHHDLKVSQLSFHTVDVSRAEKCEIGFSVLNATSSGEHKVKLMGVILSPQANEELDLPEWVSAFI